MIKAIILATAVVTFASSAHAGEFKGSYWRQSSYSSCAEEYKLTRIANRQRLEKAAADNAAINAGMQKAGAKYDASMNTAVNDVTGGIRSGVSSICSSCR